MLSDIYCDQFFDNAVTCVKNHYVSDRCHRSDADNIIEKICIQTEKIDPFCIAEPLVKHATIHMHDPKHHFLTLFTVLDFIETHFNIVIPH
jgi:hypothetical protein